MSDQSMNSDKILKIIIIKPDISNFIAIKNSEEKYQLSDQLAVLNKSKEKISYYSVKCSDFFRKVFRTHFFI